MQYSNKSLEIYNRNVIIEHFTVMGLIALLKDTSADLSPSRLGGIKPSLFRLLAHCSYH